MSKIICRTHSAVFKAKVAMAALKGDKMLAELAQQFDVHPHQISDLKNQFLKGAADRFGGDHRSAEPVIDLEALHARIDQLTYGE